MKTIAKRFITAMIGFLVLVMADQGTKYLAVIHLKGNESFPVIKNIFELQYLENRGAAFGMLQGQRIFLVIITAVVLLIMAWVYCKIPFTKKYMPLHGLIVLLTAGAVGNMIDRICYHYVVDFFYFKWIDFPIFNVADCYVVVSAIGAILSILFVYQEEDLSFFSKKK